MQLSIPALALLIIYELVFSGIWFNALATHVCFLILVEKASLLSFWSNFNAKVITLVIIKTQDVISCKDGGASEQTMHRWIAQRFSHPFLVHWLNSHQIRIRR